MRFLSALLVIAVVIGACYGLDSKKDDSFDYFLFVQLWEPATNDTAFTIHGLWPERNDGSYPSFCQGPKFSLSEIKDLVPTLNVVWPGFSNGSSETFWNHEWTKHGTCSLIEMHQFFEDAIQQNSLYPIMTAFAKANIVPSKTQNYATTAMQTAVKQVLGYSPALQCGHNQLQSIAMCVQKDLSPFDCPKNVSSYFSCPSQVQLPIS